MGIKTYNPYTPSRRQMTGLRDHKDDSREIPPGFQEEKSWP